MALNPQIAVKIAFTSLSAKASWISATLEAIEEETKRSFSLKFFEKETLDEKEFEALMNEVKSKRENEI